LKGTGNDRQSLDVYKKLYLAKPDAERGPYAFEIGSILEKHKSTAMARQFFEKAIALKFNVAASSLYLGMGYFKEGKFAEAEVYFDKVATSGIPELELVGRYYLSLCYFKLRLGVRGIQELMETEEISAKILSTKEGKDNKAAQSIHSATKKMLSPFDVGQWFGNAALLGQYDSNIQQLPIGTSNTTVGSNTATMKANFMGGIGYMSAPLDTLQWVAGYRASLNKNFNSLVRSYEYFTNTVSLYLNYQSLAKTTFGLKLEGSYVFQNALEVASDANSGYLYQKYNLNLGGGPYVRHQLTRTWRLELETGYRAQTFYVDKTQSGTNLNARFSARQGSGSMLLNPGFSVLYENNNTTGTFYYYDALGTGLLNQMQFPNGITVVQSADFLFTYYKKSVPLRTDLNMSFKLSVVKQLSPKISILGDFNYIKNYSSIDVSYTYNRSLTSLGLAYSL
jgi:tetratricopeptide (TPR) repeat protein